MDNGIRNPLLRDTLSHIRSTENIVPTLCSRPFAARSTVINAPIITHRRYQQSQHIPAFKGRRKNRVIVSALGSSKEPFHVLATDKLVDRIKYSAIRNAFPSICYTEDGERVSNITEWGLGRINEHYRKEFGEHFEEVVGGERITAEDVFAYTYAVLHDPVYRHDYAVDLLREFPRLPLYHDWDAWVKMGRELLELHIGFEDVEPYPLERVDKGSSQSSPIPTFPHQGGRSKGCTPRVMLRANAGDKERGEIHIDSETVLRGVPEFAWEYKLGNRTAIEWVLDQYKEKKPRDPTIRERFNTYRFADYKEDVIDLLLRVCTVSVRDYGGGGWDGDSSRWRGDQNGRLGREHTLAPPLSCAGHQRRLGKQATSGSPRRTGFAGMPADL